MGVYKLSNSSVKTGRTIYGSMLAGNSSWTDPDTGAMFPLQVITVGPAGASSVEFTNIPNTYSHLQVRYLSKSTTDATLLDVRLQVNSDTGSNYARHLLYGDGGSAGAVAGTSETAILGLETIGSGSARTNMFRATIVDVLDYANTNKYKTFRCLDGNNNNTSTNGTDGIRLVSGLWMNTNAITSLKFTPGSGNFVQYSQFALYGIKGA